MRRHLQEITTSLPLSQRLRPVREIYRCARDSVLRVRAASRSSATCRNHERSECKPDRAQPLKHGGLSVKSHFQKLAIAVLFLTSIAVPALAQGDQASADAKVMDFLRRTEISGFV